MTPPFDPSEREWLESLYRRSPSLSLSFQFQKFFRSIGQALKVILTRNPRDLRVHRYFDVNGGVIWHVYDPVSRKTLTSKSELEVSAWLEQYYSQQPHA